MEMVMPVRTDEEIRAFAKETADLTSVEALVRFIGHPDLIKFMEYRLAKDENDKFGRMKELWDRGKTVKEIAKEVHWKESTVRRRLIELGYSTKDRSKDVFVANPIK